MTKWVVLWCWAQMKHPVVGVQRWMRLALRMAEAREEHQAAHLAVVEEEADVHTRRVVVHGPCTVGALVVAAVLQGIQAGRVVGVGHQDSHSHSHTLGMVDGVVVVGVVPLEVQAAERDSRSPGQLAVAVAVLRVLWHSLSWPFSSCLKQAKHKGGVKHK